MNESIFPRCTYLDESLETGAFRQLFQLKTRLGIARHVPRECFADQLNFLVKDLSEMMDDRFFRQGLQAIQLIPRNGQDLFQALTFIFDSIPFRLTFSMF